MKDVVGFGALNMDLIYKDVDIERIERIVERELPPDSEGFYPPEMFQPVMNELNSHATLAAKSGGGSAANTVYVLSELGFSTAYVGKVGRDGDFLVEGLGSVDASFVARGKGNSGCALCMQSGDKRAMMIFPNENDALTKDDINKDAYQTRILHLTSFAGDTPFNAQMYAMRHVPEDVLVSFDPGEIYTKKGFLELLPILGRTDILFVNEKEMWQLTGKEPEDGCEDLMFKDYEKFGEGPHIVVCKLGKDGSAVMHYQGDYFEKRPPYVPEEKKRYPTGTGDAYDAGFLAGLLFDRDVEECAAFGNILGAQKLQVPREKFHPRWKDFKKY